MPGELAQLNDVVFGIALDLQYHRCQQFLSNLDEQDTHMA